MVKIDKDKFKDDLNDWKHAEQFRLKENLSVRKIAELSGVSHPTVSRAFAGNTLTVEKMATLCHWMGRKIDDYTSVTP